MKHFGYCGECYNSKLKGKLNAALKNKIQIGKGQRVLLAFSGGQNSGCLIHMIMSFLKGIESSKRPYHLECIYIDQSILGLKQDYKTLEDFCEKENKVKLNKRNLESFLE